MFAATGLPGWMRYGGASAVWRPGEPEMQKQELERHADRLRSELDLVMKRLSALGTDPAEK